MLPKSLRAGQFSPGYTRIAAFLILLISGCGLAMDNEDRLARGEAALAEGDYRAAVIDAKEVLREDPNSLRGRLLLGRASVAVSDGPTAEKELRRALALGADKTTIVADLSLALLLQSKFDQIIAEINVDDVRSTEDRVVVYRVLGDANIALRQPSAAREMYVAALNLAPTDLDAQLGVVTSYITEGNIPQASGALDHVLQTNPDEARAWLFSGAFNLHLQNIETAKANFEAAIRLSTNQENTATRSQAVAGLAEVLLEEQNLEEARRQLQVLQTEAPKSFQTTLLTARIAYIDEDWNTAQQHLQQILRVAPDYRPAQMLLGAVHLRSGNLSQAEQYLSAAVASLPNDRRARQLLAETRMQMQKLEEAQETLAPMITGPDADSMSLQLAARMSLAQKNVDEAIDFLRRNVAENPGNIDMQFQLAATLVQYGRSDEAQAVLDGIDVSGSEQYGYQSDALVVMNLMVDGQSTAALQKALQLAETYSDRAGPLALLGAVQLANNRVVEAAESFEGALAIDPDAVLPQRYLAGIDEALGRLDSARSRYEKILTISTDASWATFAIGRIAYRQKDFDSAVRQFQDAMSAEPTNQFYRLSLARAQKQLGNTVAAKLVLEDRFEATLEHIPSAVFLATLYSEEGDTSDSFDIAARLQRKYPDHPVPYALEGELHFEKGELQLADAAYDKAITLEVVRGHAQRSFQIKDRLGAADKFAPLVSYLEKRPLDAEARLILAQAYMQNGNHKQAISAYEVAIENQPSNVIALNNLAWLYYLSGDPRAIATARKANDLLPNNSSILDTLGWILVEKGEFEEGERHLRKAVELGNDRSEIRYHHAVALVRLGKTAEARSALTDILATGEDFDGRNDAEKLLAEL